MSKPFTLTLIDGAAPLLRKPGWHKRAMAAERAAASRRTTVAPQHGNKAADAQAEQYARWLAARDSLDVSAMSAHVQWECCAAGMRPRSVTFTARGVAPVKVDLPHWSYMAPDAVAVVLLDWSAPVVREITHTAPVTLDPETVADALAGAYGQPAEWEIGGTVDAPEPERGTARPIAAEVRFDGAEMALTTTPQPIVASGLDHDSRGADTAPIMDAASDVMEAREGEAWMPTAETHPVIAYCLSEKAWLTLRDRVQDGTFPAESDTAARFGGWRLTLADAQDLQDVASIRFAGMPRKPYTRRAAVSVSAVRVNVPAGSGFSIMHQGARPMVLHHPMA